MTIGTFLSYFVAAFLTLAIFSFLYKDNPVYKFAEHLFVGVAAGYYVFIQYKDTLVPDFWEYVWYGGDPHRWVRLGAGVLGVILLLHLWPRMSWLARWPIAFLVGSFAGLRLVNAMHAEVISQVRDLMKPVWREGIKVFAFREESVIGNILIVVGVVAILIHFFFSAERGAVLGTVSRIGIIFLMVTFGAAFGFTVLGRVSLLIGRARDLQRFEWATICAAVAVIGLLVWWEIVERRRIQRAHGPSEREDG